MSNDSPSSAEATVGASIAMLERSRRSGGDTMPFAANANDRTSPTTEGGLLTFPELLMSLLNEGQESDCMWWLPEGDAFCLQPQRFKEEVLETHFRCKFESFTRKLNRWGFRRVAGQQVPPDTIAYFQRSFHRDKPDDICTMTGGKKKPTPKYSSKSKVAMQQYPSTQRNARLAAKANEHDESLAVVKRPSLGGSGRSMDASPHGDLSVLLPSFQGNTAASLLAQGTHSGAGLASSVHDEVLERAVRIQLLREIATHDAEHQHPFQQATSADLATRMILGSNNSVNNSLGSLRLEDLFGSSSSSQGLLSTHANQADRSTADLAVLLSSHHGGSLGQDSSSSSNSNNYSEASILASMLAQQPPTAAAVAPPVPSSSSAAATKHLLEALLQRHRATSHLPAAAAARLPSAPSSSIPSSHLAWQHAETDNSNNRSESQLLQLYFMEQERQLLRQNQQRNE